jgi:hypothetical protein
MYAFETTPQRYRKCAEDLRVMVRSCLGEPSRKEYAKLAEEWDRLAKFLERTGADQAT